MSSLAKGLFLLIPALVAVFAANSVVAPFYFGLLHFEIFKTFSAHHFVNDALMALFFFLMGLEIKSEFTSGALSTPKKAALPMIAAVGGCLVPSLIYLWFNYSTPAQVGWAIPMATDIAFAVGVLALFDSKVPKNLKAFLMALAVVDDLIAVAVIALFYGAQISKFWIGVSFFVFLLIGAGLFFKVKLKWFYAVFAGIAWYCVFKSGVHATVAGVILGLMTPASFSGVKGSLLKMLAHKLEPWISFGVMPLFAFFNSGVDLRSFNGVDALLNPLSLGVLLGLWVGKPLGVIALSYLSVKMKIAEKIDGVSWGQFSVVGFFAGIGFTMALFIQGLSFEADEMKNLAKVSIFLASILSGVTGSLYLKGVFKRA